MARLTLSEICNGYGRKWVSNAYHLNLQLELPVTTSFRHLDLTIRLSSSLATKN